ncbi:hypothetical protein LSTR_LSTR011813 [Laodelphax striatellus]|uniref:Alpha-taxilin n=1 Tax=Laodelphax striatellus TaxID=195883 RepID=A0A482XW28_LAOST|nr:hypothetical protein LSTR_LSTR011813 [Laodelphax striatellus]
MEGAETETKPISKDAEISENDQPPTKETGAVKGKGQNKCGCDGPSTVKARSSREEKLKKKDDKRVEHVLKALNSLNTTEEKLAAMCKKYADIFDENRKVQLALKQSEKRNGVLQREKEQLQGEQSKSILTRSRLENLCRELQRQNKAIKDESLSKIREEEEKRKEVSAKFQSTLSEINHLMQQNTDKNSKLRDDNLDMNARLKSVCEQYELREKEVDRISKQMQLESQLAEAKLAKSRMEMAAEKELFAREKQQLLVEITQYQARCQEFQTNEINLRKQISLYNEKYDEFQRALAKSNEVFGGFKVEMDKMSKKILKLEKETITWKQRWENSHQALLSMADDKQKTDQQLGLVNRKLAALQGLCRTLQTERSAMLAKLKEAGISSDDALLTNGDVSTDVETNKEPESQTVNSCEKKQASTKSATTDNQQNSNAKCLKNSTKKCVKDKSNNEEKKSDDASLDSAVNVNGQSDASADGKVNGLLEVSNTTADVKVEVSPPTTNVSTSEDIASNDGVVGDKPQVSGSLDEKDIVCSNKDPAKTLVDSPKADSKQVGNDTKQVSADTKKVPADSKQANAKSKACKKNSRLSSPPKDIAAAGAKESTSCAASPSKGDGAKDSTPTSPSKMATVNQSSAAAGDKTATSPKATNCEAKKDKDCKKKKK